MSGKKKSKTPSAIGKLIEKSETENVEEEHELYYYVNDRVKLMKEVLKIIKPKKIKSMTPACMKDYDGEEINSMLLEELLGISNKRLKYIFNGQNCNEDSSSSTDPEDENKANDIISLDDVSEDDFVIDLDSDSEKNKRKRRKIKKEHNDKVKKEKVDKPKKSKENLNEDNLMSVLELLELQARARAIRSQLTLEANRKKSGENESESNGDKTLVDNENDDDEVIINVPKPSEIVITSSDSESEKQSSGVKSNKKITLLCDTLIVAGKSATANQEQNVEADQATAQNILSVVENGADNEKETKNERAVEKNGSLDENQPEIEETESKEDVKKIQDKPRRETSDGECIEDDDEIILIADQDEIDGLISS